MDAGDFNGIHHYRNLSTGSLFGSSAEIALRSVALRSKKDVCFCCVYSRLQSEQQLFYFTERKHIRNST